jgi:hypothetical protein
MNIQVANCGPKHGERDRCAARIGETNRLSERHRQSKGIRRPRGAETTVGEAEIEYGKIRLVKLSQGDSLRYRAGNAVNLVPPIGDHRQVVFGNQDLEHTVRSPGD